MRSKKSISAAGEARRQAQPSNMDLDELQRQRQQLARLVGRLLARHWLRQAAADPAHRDDLPALSGPTLRIQ
jgi:hypothetical protein